MPNALRTQIEVIASQFAAEVLRTIWGASLADILAESSGAGTARSQGPVTKHAVSTEPKRGPGRPRKDGNVARGGTTTGNPGPAKKADTGRLVRRTKADIEAAVAKVVALVKKTPNMRAEAIRADLKMDRKELPRVLAQGLATKKLTKKGEKRATSYKAV